MFLEKSTIIKIVIVAISFGIVIGGLAGKWSASYHYERPSKDEIIDAINERYSNKDDPLHNLYITIATMLYVKDIEWKDVSETVKDCMYDYNHANIKNKTLTPNRVIWAYDYCVSDHDK